MAPSRGLVQPRLVAGVTCLVLSFDREMAGRMARLLDRSRNLGGDALNPG
jgi:hypothetical protein